MKKIFMVLSLAFMSSHAIACPVFEGNFNCSESTGRQYKMEIHTRVESSVSIYDIKTAGHVTERADNKEHHVDKINGKINVDSKGYCEGDNFIYESVWTDPNIKWPKNPTVIFKKTMYLDKGAIKQELSYSGHRVVKVTCNKIAAHGK